MARYNAVEYELKPQDNALYLDDDEKKEDDDEMNEAPALEEYQEFRFEWQVYAPQTKKNPPIYKVKEGFETDLMPEEYDKIRQWLIKYDPIPPDFLHKAS